MNERIKELAGQLGPVATIGNWGRVEWADNVYPQLADKMYAAVDLEKFAELIVKECVRHFNEDYQRDFDTLWREDLSKSIKQHFGIEE